MTPRSGLSENSLPLAVEDRFVIFAIREASQLCPSERDAAAIRIAIERIQATWPELVPIFDFRGLQGLYSDVDEFVRSIVGQRYAHVLIGDKEIPHDSESSLVMGNYEILKVRGNGLGAQVFDLNSFLGDIPYGESYRPRPLDLLAGYLIDSLVPSPFDADGPIDLELALNEHINSISEVTSSLTLGDILALLEEDAFSMLRRSDIGNGLSSAHLRDSLEELLRSYLERPDRLTRAIRSDPYGTLSEFLHAAYFHAYLRHIHRYSILGEFTLRCVGDAIVCLPYHCHAVHEIELRERNTILIGRPSALANATKSVFSDEIAGFERLIHTPQVKEAAIQRFLESHPNFLYGLNYENIYPQVVLEREDASPLKPDFILEPFEEGWCDILDLKLPRQKIIVGRKDRAALASGITEVIAQLREYAAYFEEGKHRSYVRQKYGVNIYRPRLIAIVGRDLRGMDDPQLRRALTAYDNCRILTFDELLAHSRRRMLI